MGLTDQDAELLAHSIARFPHLVAYRNLFIDAGSVRFLTQWLRWLEEFEFDDLKSSVQNEYALVERALARLLTEVVDDDARAIPTPWGLPRTYKRPQETMSLNADLALRTMRLSCIDEDAVEEIPGDIILFSHRLRLQLVAFPLTWYSGNLKESVKEYYARLMPFKRLNTLESEDRMSIVNTTIYVATRVIDPPQWTKPTEVVSARLEHKHGALDAFASLVLHNPGMDFALLRQICWALCVLSIPERRLIPKFDDFHLLVTQVRRMDRLLDALRGNVLAPRKQHPVMLHTMLVVLEELLYSTYAPGRSSDKLEEADRIKLIEALITRYPTFLQELHAELLDSWNCDDSQAAASWQHGSFSLQDSLRLLRRVVRVSGFLGYYCPTDLGPLKIEREEITHFTLEILQFMCSHDYRDSDPEDRIAIHRVAYGAACRFTILNSGVPTPIVPPVDEFVFDNYSARAVGEQMVAALRVASAVFEPPQSIKTVLAMMADLRYISTESKFRWGILAHLRRPDSEVPELLDLLLQKSCDDEAREAISTLKGAGGSERPRPTPRQANRKRRPARPRLDTTKAGIRLK